jgi:magnesium-transporting ATPase (P-type)
LHESRRDGRFIFLKGAAEVVLARCSQILDAAGDLTTIDRPMISAQIEEMAERGLRVLALARRDFSGSSEDFTPSGLGADFTLLGLQAMIDPPREEAVRAVEACQSAGIRVKMITGDHALTAAVIAQQVGLCPASGDGRPRVVTGRQLAEISNEDLIDLCEKTEIFARVSPEQKLRLVRAMQAQGHVVAMTGDGVNDAPALKQADIGVAMGIAGTEVSKEAADMVLTDDNFATIEAAVEEGRGVFDNITKFIVWTLPTNLGDGLVIMAAIFAGVALPILPLQILWINMNAAVLLGLVLAFEPKEPDIMRRMPREPKQPILTRSLVERIFLVGVVLLAGAFGLFWSYKDQGLDLARTLAVNFFVFVQIFYAFNCRSLTRSMFRVGLFSNPWFWLGVALMVLLQLAFTHTPLMNRLFHSVPMGLEHWLLVVGLAFLVYPIVEIEKWLRTLATRRQASDWASTG